MSEEERASRDLQIAEDLAFQRRTWTVERLGWAAFAATLVAGAIGVFGGGPLGDTEVRTADGSLAVAYPRFARMHSPLTLRVRLTPAAPADGELRIWFTREYLEQLNVERVTPPPERVELGRERIEYVFPWRGTAGAAAVVFVIEAQAPGAARGRIGSGEGAGVEVRHLLYP